ncbi:LamG domain-containing protein [Streptomyces griseorubiginosus]|uniref:LamG domain-containing protein n=1 Tax=Streptomyces griseorubiginosus TaxID=67304 RepID=UPI0036BF23A5
MRRLALIPALAGLLLTVPAASARAEESAPTDPLLAAQTEAVASGQDVPVDSLTTQTSTVTANPDGMFTSLTSVMPVRVLKNGVWTPVDASLATNPDGTLSPKATPNDVTLSGGGNGPLVTLTDQDGHSMALTMPFTLPAPTVSDDTALYKSVLPGVDLSVSVTDQGGFSDVLIVHDATAAADPHIKKLTEAASTQGLTLTASDSGGMDATAADGTVAYTSPRPLMWDSSPLPGPPTQSAPTAATTGDAPAASSPDGPGAGATVNTVPMSTTTSGVTLAPDTTVLNDPATTYPVYIDPFDNPVAQDSGHYDEVYSSSTCSDSPQYDKPQTNGEGVGYQRWGGICGTGLERSYYAIPTEKLDPSMQVYDASITVSSTYAASWDCSQNQPITLHTTGAIDSGTDWNNKPGTVDSSYDPVTTTIPSAANSGSNCSNHTATFKVKDQAQRIATYHSASGDYWTVALYGDESISSSNDDYLRLSSKLALTVKFDIPPDVPVNLLTTPPATGANGSCVTSGDGWIGATTYSGAGSNIQLHSTVKSNVSGENIKAVFHVWDRTVLDSSGNAQDDGSRATGYVSADTARDVSLPIGFTLKDGHEYGWDAYAQDNGAPLYLTSGISDHCWFKTDFTPPNTPDVADNPDVPVVGTGPTASGFVTGSQTSFTVTAADGAPSDSSCTPNACLSSGIDHFLWRLDNQPTAATGTPASITSTDSQGVATGQIPVKLPTWGVHTLYVAAVDAAGNISQAPASYTFAVPWNSNTTNAPGDISGDGVPDLLATTKTGDLEMIPGDTDPAQSATPAQSGPVSTASAIRGPALVSIPADSPDGTGWNNYLIAHRGNLHGADVDDLFAYNKQTKQFYIVKNDFDPVDDSATPFVRYSTYPGYVGKRFDVVDKDNCASSDIVADDTRCRTAGYNNQSWDISQLVTPGNVYGNSNYPAVITVENKKLWLYQADSIGHLKDPILLGDGDWSGLTLITPGTVQGKPTLWARDNSTGALYTYSLALNSSGLPPLLHASTPTTLPLTLPPNNYPAIASPGDLNSPTGGPDGNPDLYVTGTHGELIEYPGTTPTSTTATFAAPVSLGTVTNSATHWWNLDDGSGTTTKDNSGTLDAALSGAYAWATDTNRGKILKLTGTTGYAATTGPAIDTSKSFTVSAWVNPTSLTANSTFVSQSDTAGNSNGFQLYYSSGAHAWAFNLHNDNTGTTFTGTYGGTPTIGQWAHLVGVYDASTNQITLYVNGRQVDTKAFGGTPWNATGAIQIGRRVALGAYGEYANSEVSDIHLYNTALPPADAASTGDNPTINQFN